MFIFRADGNSTIGMGHIMRCFSIADCLREKGKKSCFLVSKDSDFSRVQALGFPVLRLQREDSHGWSSEEAAYILSAYDVDAVILDSYRVVPEDFSRLKAVAPLYYIDDLWAFDYDADAIINYNIEADEDFYFPTEHPGRKLYLGPSYFPMRKEMLPSHPGRLRSGVKSVLITTGSTDPCQISRNILQWIDPAEYPDISFGVLLGAFYETEYISEFETLFSPQNNVSFLTWGQNMKHLYESTDLMIAPGSTMVYEALTFGISCISYCFAENQLSQCLAMDAKGTVPFIGDFRQDKHSLMAQKLRRLFRESLSLPQRGVHRTVNPFCPDGKGAVRIAEILL